MPETKPVDTADITDRQLVDALINLGLLSERQGELAGFSLPSLVDRAGVLEAQLDDLRSFLTRLRDMPEVEAWTIPQDLLDLVPASRALTHHLLPLARIGAKLVVGYEENGAGRERLLQLLDDWSLTGEVHFLAWPLASGRLREACERHYAASNANGAISQAMSEQAERAAKITLTTSEQAPAGPIATLLNDVLVQAVTGGASDIHLDPTEDSLVVRLRIDGILHDHMVVPKALESAILNRLKILAELNITERRHPQDGRFTVSAAGLQVDVRVAIAPTQWGELAVLRLLKPLATLGSIDGLGMSPADLARFIHMIDAPHGLILVTGPTGSGKSSTLYAALSHFDRIKSHVMTLEDPIEMTLDRVLQMPVHAAIGVTFASLLRSILRLDPDVVMVGEIRDGETLEIAMQAALTGRLVLSTLHTNDTVASITRLQELGASPPHISATLVGVCAQRLVRRICAHCRESYTPGADECRKLELPADTPVRLARGLGCPTCKGTGFKGRMAIFEIFELDDELASAIASGASAIQLRHMARAGGMTSLASDGRRHVLAGETTLAEIERVARG